MNVIICCGGTMLDGRTEASEVKGINHHSKCDYLLNGETILERMVRLFRDEGLTDITVAYSFIKPKAEGVKYRRVKYRQGLMSTILQCRDLFSHTLIIRGDTVFSKQALREVLRQPFDEILNEVMGMILMKPMGAKILQAFFDEHEETFMSESMGRDYQHYFRCLALSKFRKELGPHVEMFLGKHFICDCDSPSKLEWIRTIITQYLDKGKEPPWRNAWQERIRHLQFPGRPPWIIKAGVEST